MQVSVMWSPSSAGFVSPSISGFCGTPEGRNGGNYSDRTDPHSANATASYLASPAPPTGRIASLRRLHAKQRQNTAVES
ncbi:hypothetical protein EYF80_038626 [Liparis tanakae]|uniref:Uncharacterized protein n=1 Tax=Liparis tanakae TaxID=230148 RepID=A0A4Z2GC50_9TELE|nr:hypothetical protein EYF80_038626 [Liparis tanakae]